MVFSVIPAGYGLPECHHPLLFARRILVVVRIQDRLPQGFDDVSRRRFVRITDGKRDAVDTGGLDLLDLAAQVHEQISGKAF